MGRLSIRRGWLLAIALAVVTLVAATAVALFTHTNDTPLDPDNTRPTGAAALRAVLDDHDAQVRVIRSPDDLGAAGGTTVLVTQPQGIGNDRLAAAIRRAHAASRVVLVDPPAGLLSALGFQTSVASSNVGSQRADNCPIAALRGLTLSRAEATYKELGSQGTTCFTSVSGAGVILQRPSSAGLPEIVLFGAPETLTNQHLTEADNAAIVIRLVGADRRITWLAPDSAAPAPIDAQHGPAWPAWVGPSVLLLLLALPVLGVWRGRRFGALVREPLPVAIKANDATISRGELYRRAQDSERSTTILRQATDTRLRRALAIPLSASGETAAARVAELTGRPPHEVHQLLYGSSATDEAEMTRIARELHALERQVRP